MAQKKDNKKGHMIMYWWDKSVAGLIYLAVSGDHVVDSGSQSTLL